MVRSVLLRSVLGLALVSPWVGRRAEGQSRTLDATGLGTAPGASPGRNTTIYGGPPGASPGRYQPALTSPQPPNLSLPLGAQAPEALPAREVVVPKPPRTGLIEPPEENPWIGPKGGITLDEAIDLLCKNNLDLRTQFSEIPQAEADVWTASLRSNPILYADSQQIPYGNFSPKAAGGPTQYDINVVYPIDWSGKRQARTRAADLAQFAVRASYRDAVRLTIDNLYQAYVDALVAQQDFDLTRPNGPGPLPDLAATISVDEPKSALEQTQRSLGLLMNLPFETVSTRRLYGRLAFREKEEHPLPPVADLVGRALVCRADVVTQRLAVDVAEANVKAVKANRFEDVLVLYQPYTFSNGRPLALQNSLSWTLGVTVALPVYNRQQGNLVKARLIADQARTKLASVQNTVDAEVRGAVLEHDTAHQVVKRCYTDFLESLKIKAKLTRIPNPVSEKLDENVRTALEEMRTALKQSNAALEMLKQDNYDDKGRKFKESLVRHRRSMLRLNTVIGERLMP